MNMGALGVHRNNPLGDATVSECGRHSYSALVHTNVSYFESHNSTPIGTEVGAQAALPWSSVRGLSPVPENS